MNKENVPATPTFTRKRAKSVSTPPTAKPLRSARGILKGNNNDGDDAHTIAFIPIHSASKRTESAEKRRKSLSRRVSFASHASVRLFEKPGESPTSTTPRRSTRGSPAKSPISPKSPTIENEESNDDITMDLTGIINTPAPPSPLVRRSESPRKVDEEEEEDEDSMDLTTALGQIKPVTPTKLFSMEEEDETVNMDETAILSHTSMTIATEEDSTQRFVEGSVTQADGLTQNMDFTRALPNNIVHEDLPNITENEDTNMDMTKALPVTIDTDSIENMDMTRALPSNINMGFSWGNVEPTIPVETIIEEQSLVDISMADITMEQSQVTEADMSFTRILSPKRRLSSGAVRSPRVMTPVKPKSPARSPRKSASPRKMTPRRSLADVEIPRFGTPEAQVLTEPDSVARPEFGANLVAQDMRISLLKDKIQSLTPKKTQTPSRSLLTPSVRRPTTPAPTPARVPSRADALKPITLNDFMKMTGVSFLTGLSTTRRRETILPPRSNESPEVTKIMSENFHMPMLEMYQHACRELTRYITEGRAMCDEIESDMNEQNPEIFDQYRRADAAGKREIEGKLKHLKTLARSRAKGVWYVWRENLLSNVLVPLKANLAKLQAEADRAEAQAIELKPKYEALQAEHAALQAEVNGLLKAQEEYDAFDHEGAARLDAELAEIKAANVAAEAELAAAEAEERVLEEEIAALEQQNAQRAAEAAEYEKLHPKVYSPQEIAAMDRECRAMVEKTGFEIIKITDVITFKLLDTLLVHVKEKITFTLLRDCPILKYFSTRMTYPTSTIKESLATIRTQWKQALELQAQYDAILRLYPIESNVNSDDNLDLSISLLVPTSRTKLSVVITLHQDFDLQSRVERVYGSLDATRIKSLIDDAFPRLELPRLA